MWFQWPRVRTPPPTPAFPANSTPQQPLTRRDCIRLFKQPAAFMVPTGAHAFLTSRPQCCEPLAGVSTSSTQRHLLNPMPRLVGAAQPVRPFSSTSVHFHALEKPPPPVEQAARLAMPAVTPAERHNLELYGSSKRQPPPRMAAWHARLRAPPQPAADPRGASRQACHAGGHAGRATQSRAVRESQRHPARTPARSTSTRRAA